MNRYEITAMLDNANDQMTSALRAFHNSNAYDFESALFGLKRTVRKLEQAATEWADEVEQSERIKRKSQQPTPKGSGLVVKETRVQC